MTLKKALLVNWAILIAFIGTNFSYIKFNGHNRAKFSIAALLKAKTSVSE